ncbi:hypothetical protein [Tatumella terrea]|uniref:Uncharacterized protein n=1 Tax=Tatumella terrea TaxID=419007 RepID=A0ABW1W030_9GAMM
MWRTVALPVSDAIHGGAERLRIVPQLTFREIRQGSGELFFSGDDFQGCWPVNKPTGGGTGRADYSYPRK